MPYLELPHLENLRLFYVCNPINEESCSSLSSDPTEPECRSLDPKRHTIVMVHAGSTSHAAFSNQFKDARLAQFNLISFDSRMHGRSTGDDVEKYSMEDNADTIMAGLDMLGVGRFTLLGEGGLGASAATWIACKRPHQVQGIVIASPGPFLTDDAGQLNDRKRWWMEMAFRNKDGKGDGSGNMPDECVDFLGEVLLGDDARLSYLLPLWRNAYLNRYGAGRSSHDMNHIVTSLMGRHVQHIPEDVRAVITAPVLILQGADDNRGSTEADARAWRDAFTSAREGAAVHLIASAPHLMCETEASIVTRLLLNFVQRHLPPADNKTVADPSYSQEFERNRS